MATRSIYLEMSLSSGGVDNFLQGEDRIQYRDGKLNTAIELALLHGIYTGIVSVALWNICGWNILAMISIYLNKLSHTVNSKFRTIGRVMVASIIFLYITSTINFFLNWEFRHDTTTGVEMVFTIGGKKAVVTGFPAVGPETPRIGITVVVSTVIADSIMIWRCWMVWGRRWLVVLIPILCLISGLVCQIWVIVFRPYSQIFPPGYLLYVSLLVIYISCILATTLWCTVLIVIRILTVIRGANDRRRDYRYIIEVLVESSALHSVTLIIYIALEARKNAASDYFDTLAAITTGVAPTLLAGRIAAGHARPDDAWEGSIMSSLRFEAHPRADAETYSQIDSMVDNDLEAQSIQVDEPEEISPE
ncbi:hypothetical protein ARMGADRAFT_1123997 [Armillaria gallica]|uniref:Uncharacterized protein n=1 Tax=Armillaria gallica TaxID=47427 RepID=A0A2H3DUI0_ARMGA|nr:hypothetical protein ARMGADRAFT_1123997 [Armillaria gallica]